MAVETDESSVVAPGVAAATVLYRADAALLRALLDVLQSDCGQIYVFANGRPSPEVEEILARVPRTKVIRSDTNVGLGAALNAVVSAAASDGFAHVHLFDQDSTPRRGLSRQLRERFIAGDLPDHPLAVIGPVLAAPKDLGYLTVRYWRREKKPGDPNTPVDFVSTSGSLLSTSAWRRVGPFREDYFIGGIDVEWGYRAWALGLASMIAEDIQMLHRWGEQENHSNATRYQAGRQSPDRIYYYVRNAVHGLTLAHMPVRWKVRQITRMTAQIGLMLIGRRDIGIGLIRRALTDGWNGRLGPIRDVVSLDAHK